MSAEMNLGRAPRRTTQADPRLLTSRLFDPDINARLREELPAELRRNYFERRNMPPHWLPAILEDQPNYRKLEKSIALNFQDLPETMATEFVWCTERQVQLGMRINSQMTSRLTRAIALVIARGREELVSLLDLDVEEWIRQIREARLRESRPLPVGALASMSHLLNRHVSILVHAYHQGPWWTLNVWNPKLDPRILLREHEPQRSQLIYLNHLTTPWLREGAKWWLSRQLEREVYTWSTLRSRQHDLHWFQLYLDQAGCDGSRLAPPDQLVQWAQGYRQWLRTQEVIRGPRKGQPLGETVRRGAMTAVEQLYRFMVEEGNAPAKALGAYAWTGLTANHAVLFKFGDKPVGPKVPPPEMVLSETTLSRIIDGCQLLERPRAEDGIGDEQLSRILKLLIKTGRRVNEIAMLDFEPLIAIPFPDPLAHVARLRYQQTKIMTGDATILIDQEIVDIIHTQQQYARQFMIDHGNADTTPKYLFLARQGNRNGDRPYPTMTARALLNELGERLDIRDDAGRRITLSKTHMFRHAKATSLLNAGVPIHVGMRYMGHSSPAMFMHYAQTLAQTQETEFLRYRKLTADGREYERDPREMFEALSLAQRTDRVLPHGYCTLPPRQSCDKGNACLSCTKFVTDESFAPVLRTQLGETQRLIQERQQIHTTRYGEPMSEDNIWLQGRHAETASLNRLLVAIDSVRNADGTITPLRGVGAPQREKDQ